MQITISLLNPSEWKDYKKIRLEALVSDPHAFGSSYKKEIAFSDKEWQERPKNPLSYIFIAKDGAQPIGLLGFRVEVEEKNTHLWGMFVNPHYRGKGLGRKLMEYAIEKAKSIENIDSLTLDVNEDQQAAISMYQSMGFQQYGSYVYTMGDEKRHTLLEMKKYINVR